MDTTKWKTLQDGDTLKRGDVIQNEKGTIHIVLDYENEMEIVLVSQEKIIYETYAKYGVWKVRPTPVDGQYIAKVLHSIEEGEWVKYSRFPIRKIFGLDKSSSGIESQPTQKNPKHNYIRVTDSEVRLPDKAVVLDECGQMAVLIGSYIELGTMLPIYLMVYTNYDLREAQAMSYQWEVSDAKCGAAQFERIKTKVRDIYKDSDLSFRWKEALKGPDVQEKPKPKPGIFGQAGVDFINRKGVTA